MDVVGNIRLATETRLTYLLATIRSMEPIAPLVGRFLLNVENGRFLLTPLRRLLREVGFRDVEVSRVAGAAYGDVYRGLLARTTSDVVMHFEEDHCCVVEDAAAMAALLELVRAVRADVVPVTFHRLYQERFAALECEEWRACGRVYPWDAAALARARAAAPAGRPTAYFVGTNALFSRGYAVAFWGREIAGSRPHGFELVEAPVGMRLRVVVPGFEVLRAVDDEHGLAGSSCLVAKGERWTQLAALGLRDVSDLRRAGWRWVGGGASSA